jgi:hypothetical protein
MFIGSIKKKLQLLNKGHNKMKPTNIYSVELVMAQYNKAKLKEFRTLDGARHYILKHKWNDYNNFVEAKITVSDILYGKKIAKQVINF